MLPRYLGKSWVPRRWAQVEYCNRRQSFVSLPPTRSVASERPLRDLPNSVFLVETLAIPLASRRKSPIDKHLKENSIAWLQGSSVTESAWSVQDVARARHLLERWITCRPENSNGGGSLAPRFATLILKRWLHQRQPLDVDSIPLMEYFYRVLHVWQQQAASLSQSSLNAYTLLQTFHTYSRANNDSLVPGPKAYSMVFETFNQAPNGDPAPSTVLNMAEQLIEQLLMLPEVSTDTVVAKNSYLSLLANHGHNPEKVERFARDQMLRGNAKTYAAVLQAWAKSSRPDQTLAVWDEMIQRGIMNQICFNICLRALGTAGRADQAEALLWKMQSLPQHGSSDIQLDAYSYLAVIHAWTKVNNSEKAMAIAKHMLQNENVPQSNVTHAAILNALARQPNAGPQVERLLFHMEETCQRSDTARPCRRAYTIAIRAWGSTMNAIDAPDRATALVSRMHEQSRSGQSWLTPCTITYTSLIQAWARSNRSDAPERALTVFRRMEHAAGDLAPDVVALNAVLHALARHGKVEEARSLLDEFKQRAHAGIATTRQGAPRPDTISWTTVIHGLGKHRSDASGKQANMLLYELEALYDTTHDCTLAPTASIYTAVIAAHGRDGEAAEAVLWHMVDRFEPSPGQVDSDHHCPLRVAPTTEVCNAVLRVWSKSDNPLAPQRAESLLRWMEQSVKSNRAPDVHPDKETFDFILHTWNNSQRRHKATHLQRLRAEMSMNYPTLM